MMLLVGLRRAFKRMRSRFLLMVSGWLFGLAVLGALKLSGLEDRWERQTLTWRFQARPAPGESSPVTVVALRGTRLGSVGHPSREELAELLERLAALPEPRRPAVVAIDLLLTSEDCPACDHAPTAVQRIAAACRTLGRVVWPVGMTFTPVEMTVTGGVQALERHRLAPPASGYTTSAAVGLLTANPRFADALYRAAAGVGSISAPPDTEKGDTIFAIEPVTAWSPPEGLEDAVSDPPWWLPTFGLSAIAVTACPEAAARCIQTSREQVSVTGGHGFQLPLDRRGRLWINYQKRFRGHLEDSDLQARVAISPRCEPREVMPEVLLFVSGPLETSLMSPDGSWCGDLAQLGGRIVLVVDAQERSEVRTPLGPDVPQWSLHAQLISNVVMKEPLRILPAESHLGLGLVISFLAALVRGLRRDDVWPAAPGISGLARSVVPVLTRAPEVWTAVLWGIAAFGALAWRDLWLPVVAPLGALSGTFFGWHLAVPWQLRRRIAQANALAASHHAQARKLDGLVGSLALASDELRSRLMELEHGRDESQRELEALDVLDQQLDEVWRRCERYSDLGQLPLEADAERTLTELMEHIHRTRQELEAATARIEATEALMTGFEPDRREIVRSYHAIEEAIGRFHQRRLKRLSELSRRLRDLSRVTGAAGDMLTIVDPVLLEKTGIPTVDPAMRAFLRDAIELHAGSDVPIFLVGEPGTERRRLAGAMHRASGRSGAWIVENCRRYQSDEDALVMLFGRDSAYLPITGAMKDAEGGTLFLEHVDRLSPVLQAKLLEAIESFGRPGASGRPPAIRFILGALAEPGRCEAEGRLLPALRAGVPGGVLRIPPLRERAADIPILAAHFLRKSGGGSALLPPDRLRLLQGWHWPGNSRQLREVVRAVTKRAGRSAGGAPAPNRRGPLQNFTARHNEWLAKLRRHGFRTSACAKDPAGPKGNQQHWDRVYNIVLCEAFLGSGYRVDATVGALVGGVPDCYERVEAKLMSFLRTQGKNIREKGLEKQLADLYRVYRRAGEPVYQVLRDLESGSVPIAGQRSEE